MSDTATPTAKPGIVTMSDGTELPVTFHRININSDGSLFVFHEDQGLVLAAAAGRWDSVRPVDEETKK